MAEVIKQTKAEQEMNHQQHQLNHVKGQGEKTNDQWIAPVDQPAVNELIVE